jgi:hypothetical protein
MAGRAPRRSVFHTIAYPKARSHRWPVLPAFAGLGRVRMANDDRPQKSAGWLPDLNKASEAQFNKYPDPVRLYTETYKSWSDTE